MATRAQLVLFCLGLVLAGSATAVDVSPIEKVLSLMDGLTAKVTAEGEAEDKAFKEYMEWCDDTKTETGFEIKTATSDKGELEAAIAKATSDISVATTEIDELAKSISADESDLKAATEVREKEHADFAAVESELVDTIDTLERAITILEKEMAKNPALLQKAVNSADLQSLVSALETVIDAAAFSTDDRHKLVALVQDQQTDQDGDSELGAPAGATYKSHSTNIVEVLQDLKEKADGQLADARKAEMTAKHNFDMLKQSLNDELAADNKELSKQKSALASAEETKATSEGDLEMTTKDLADAEAKLEMVTTDCKNMAAGHEASVASRAEELKAVAEAKKIIVEMTSGAADHQYSFLQVRSLAARSGLRTGTDLAKFEIVEMVKRLAKKEHSAALAQLASRISAVARYGTKAGQDPFSKIKSLISDLIATLEKEAAEEATKKAYCDEEMGKTANKKAELNADIDALTAKLDKAASTSAKLKGQVAELQKELAAMSKMQAEMDGARTDEHAAFVTAEADLKQGIAGVQGALEVLREYYGSGAALVQDSAHFASMMQQPAMPEFHSSAGGAGSSIIGMLEVCESDFSKSLAEETVKEDEAATEYAKMTQENKISKSTKEQDVKYKTSEAKGLDKTVSEATSDRESLQSELAAQLEYGDKLTEECTYAPDSYEERKARREAEIAGLKEAMKYLEGSASLLQRRKLRGA